MPGEWITGHTRIRNNTERISAQAIKAFYSGYNRNYYPKTDLDPIAVENGVYSSGKKQIVKKEFTLDYTSPLKNVIMESVKKLPEYGTQDIRTIYGLEKVSSQITQKSPGVAANDIAKVYYHHDRLGSVDYVTDSQTGAVAGFSTYDEWGKPIKISPMNIGGESWKFTEYTVHPYDPLLGVYYAKARMYDPANSRMLSVDPVKGTISNPQTMNQYIYCLDNPINYIDPAGLFMEFAHQMQLVVAHLSTQSSKCITYLYLYYSQCNYAVHNPCETSVQFRNGLAVKSRRSKVRFALCSGVFTNEAMDSIVCCFSCLEDGG